MIVHHVITFSRSVMEDEIYDAIYEVDKATYDLIKDICSQNDTSKTAQSELPTLKGGVVHICKTE